jgi:hypothetical protein
MTVSLDKLEGISSAFERHIDEIAAVTATRSRAEIAELHDFEAPQFWEAVREITRGSRRSQAARLRNGRELPTECPAPDLEAARLAVSTGVSLPASLKSYRVGHAVGSDAWLDAIEETDLDDPSRRECLRVVSRFVDAYDDRLMELFTDEYMRSSEQNHRGGRRRVALIREVLEGTTDDVSELAYDLDLEHLAVLAWGPNAAASVRRLAASLDRRLLMAEVSDQLFWGWLGSRSPLEPKAHEDLTRFEPTVGCALCLSNPEYGPSGFRRSHRQAGDAYLVALRHPQPVTLYADVALEALALRDEQVARDFAAGQLRSLNGDDKLRETLRRYFASSQNAAATAAALGVHEQTVARRLKAVEERIGCPLNHRRAELELALRLEELLNSPPAPH